MDISQNSNGGGKVVSNNNITRLRCCDFVLRFLAFSLTLVAAVLVGVDKQTKVVAIPVISTLPPLDVPVTAKSHFFSAFVFFVVVNAIACGYAAITLVLTLATRGGGNKGLALMIIILDLVMVALLFSGNGAATAVGLLGLQGNSHVQWRKVCNVFERFCHQMAAAIFLSVVGSGTFLLLVVLAAWNLHKKLK